VAKATPVPALMIQGTGSDVGKSLLVAGLGRALSRRGLRVRPFKPQNMSNNAAVTADGGEIGRAQWLQARACRVEPSVDMNPVLLKPQSETGAQVVVQGRVVAATSAYAYTALKPRLLTAVLESFARLSEGADLVLVEGAGSAAEINLRAGDIANMGFAEAADLPVLLAGDIERGGVIASVVGTCALLPTAERARIRGVIINKFRGDPRLFDGGIAAITAHTGWPVLGVVPYFPDAVRLPAEDALALGGSGANNDLGIGTRAGMESAPGTPAAGAGDRPIRIAVPRLSRIANFDDLDPLRLEPGVEVAMIAPGQALPGTADLVILPGSKSTLGDLAFLRAQGWDIDLAAHHRRGGHILGLCAGFQMLGQRLFDPDGSDGPAGTAEGLNYLELETVLSGTKTLALVSGRLAGTAIRVQGYEMHIGRTTGRGLHRPWLELAPGSGAGKGASPGAHSGAGTGRGAGGEGDGEGDGGVEGEGSGVGGVTSPTAERWRPEGAVSADGRVIGCYVHGLFADDAFRHAYLDSLRQGRSGGRTRDYAAMVDATLDALADHLERYLDIAAVLAIARSRAAP